MNDLFRIEDYPELMEIIKGLECEKPTVELVNLLNSLPEFSFYVLYSYSFHQIDNFCLECGYLTSNNIFNNEESHSICHGCGVTDSTGGLALKHSFSDLHYIESEKMWVLI